jgi:CspA family cold shock protein
MSASSPRLTSTGKYVINVLLAVLIYTALTWLPSFDFKWLVGLLGLAFLTTSVATRGIVLPKLSAKPKSNQKRQEGNVKWFNGTKGFGFITGDDGDEVFVHFRHVDGLSKRDIKPGQRVSYQVVDSDRGPQAEHVKPL